MSTVANSKTANAGSRSATVFIVATVTCAAAMLGAAGLQLHSWHTWQFLGLLLASTLTARLKVKLPGLSSNMSVSLPFLLITMTQMSLPEMLLTAAVSIFAQSIPKAPHRFDLVHTLFNVSSGILATGLGWEAFHHLAAAHDNATSCLLFGCLTYLAASTLPLAGIISLTEKQNAFRTWLEIMQMSFPYYVASTGLASIALSLQGNSTWSLLVGMSLVAFVMYHSYRRYFASAHSGAPISTPAPACKTKAAAASL